MIFRDIILAININVWPDKKHTHPAACVGIYWDQHNSIIMASHESSRLLQNWANTIKVNWGKGRRRRRCTLGGKYDGILCADYSFGLINFYRVYHRSATLPRLCSPNGHAFVRDDGGDAECWSRPHHECTYMMNLSDLWTWPTSTGLGHTHTVRRIQKCWAQTFFQWWM